MSRCRASVQPHGHARRRVRSCLGNELGGDEVLFQFVAEAGGSRGDDVAVPPDDRLGQDVAVELGEGLNALLDEEVARAHVDVCTSGWLRDLWTTAAVAATGPALVYLAEDALPRVRDRVRCVRAPAYRAAAHESVHGVSIGSGRAALYAARLTTTGDPDRLSVPMTSAEQSGPASARTRDRQTAGREERI